MPQKRGNGNENNGASRGQAPGNHGRGRGGSHNSKFADYSQSMTIGINDSDDCMERSKRLNYLTDQSLV